MNASCSCASSRFGAGVCTRRRQVAVRDPLNRRLKAVHAARRRASTGPATSRRMAPMLVATIDEIAPEQRRDARRRDAGRNADARAARVRDRSRRCRNERSTLSSPVRTCVRGTSRGGVGCGSAALPMYSSASRLRASTRLSLSDSVTTDPCGSGMSLNSVCTRVRLRPRPSTPTSAPCWLRTGYGQHDRRLARDPARHELADLRLAWSGDLADVGHRRR